jgi:hypothetical protein
MSTKQKQKSKKQRMPHRNAPGPSASRVGLAFVTQGIDAVKALEPSTWVIRNVVKQLSASAVDVTALREAYPDAFAKRTGKSPLRVGETRMYTVQQIGESQFARICLTNIGVKGAEQVRVVAGEGWSLVLNSKLPDGAFRVVGAVVAKKAG